MTMATLGGMMGPITDEAPVMPVLKLRGYFWSCMARISRAPRPAASATAVPDMPAKIILARTLT